MATRPGSGALDLGLVVSPSGPALRGELSARVSKSWAVAAGGQYGGRDAWAGWLGAAARW